MWENIYKKKQVEERQGKKHKEIRNQKTSSVSE